MSDDEIDALWNAEQLSVPQIVRRRAIARAAILADRKAAQPADEWLREATDLLDAYLIQYDPARGTDGNARAALLAHLSQRVAQAVEGR